MTSPRNKARYDLLYIKHRSFGLDLKLVILTLVRVFFKLVSASALLAWALILLLLMPEQLRGVRIGVLKFHFSVIYFFPLALFLYILIARRMNTARLYLRRTVIDAPLAAFTFCSLVGLNNAADSFVALRGLAYYVCVGFAVYYLVVNLAVSEPFIHRATTFFLTVVCSLAGLAVIEYVVQMSTGIPDGLHRVALTLDIPLVLASYFVVAAPMTAARLQASKGSYSRCIWGAVLVLILVGCTLTFTRSAIFALVVALLIYVARQNKRMVPLVVLGGLLLLGTLSTLAPFRFDVATVATRFWQRTQGQLRLVLIVAKTNPECLLMGVGSRSLTVYLSHLGIAIGGPASKLSAGNSYIVWLMEEGVIGGFIMLCTVVLILRELWKAATRIANRRLSCLAWGVFSSLLGLLIMMWFCNLFTYLPTQMLFWGIAGLGVSIPHLFRTGAADYYRLIHVREALRP